MTVLYRTFDIAREHPVRSVVVDDKATPRACGASLPVAYDALAEHDDAQHLTVIVCGGATRAAADMLTSAA